MIAVMATKKKAVRVVCTIPHEQIYEFMHRLENRLDVDIVGRTKTEKVVKFVLASTKFPPKWKGKEVNPKYSEMSANGFLSPELWELDV